MNLNHFFVRKWWKLLDKSAISYNYQLRNRGKEMIRFNLKYQGTNLVYLRGPLAQPSMRLLVDGNCLPWG